MATQERRDALERTINGRLGACSHDELRVIDGILLGLEKGRPEYGPLDLSKPRDWRGEADQERRDMAIYDACARLSQQDDAFSKAFGAAELDACTECGRADGEHFFRCSRFEVGAR